MVFRLSYNISRALCILELFLNQNITHKKKIIRIRVGLSKLGAASVCYNNISLIITKYDLLFILKPT